MLQILFYPPLSPATEIPLMEDTTSKNFTQQLSVRQMK